jgi:MFS family permease
MIPASLADYGAQIGYCIQIIRDLSLAHWGWRHEITRPPRFLAFTLTQDRADGQPPRLATMSSRWRMLTGLSTINFLIVGVCAVSVSLLLTPLMAEFSWKNSSASGIATAYSLASLLASPVLGMLIDRYGERIVMSGGLAAIGAGYLGLSFCRTLIEFYADFVVIGVGYGAAYYLASTTIVAKRMGAQKNLGMGILFGAGSAGAAAIAIVLGWSIKGFGWRETSMTTALLMFSLIPLTWLIVRDVDAVETLSIAGSKGSKRSPPPAKLFVSPYFLLVTAASAFAAFGMGGINFHVVPILLRAGLSGQLASGVFGASWLLSAIGSLGAGAVANRFGAKRILAISLLLGAIGTLALAFVQNVHIGVLSIIIFVVMWGATANCINQFLPIMFIDRYGAEHLAIVLGVQSALMGLVGSFAPMATGALYDLYKDYGGAIFASAAGCMIAFAIVAGFRTVARPVAASSAVK